MATFFLVDKNKNIAKNMNKERKGEIALALLKYQLAHEALRLGSIKREIGNVAKEIKVPVNELKEFDKELIEEELSELLAS